MWPLTPGWHFMLDNSCARQQWENISHLVWKLSVGFVHSHLLPRSYTAHKRKVMLLSHCTIKTLVQPPFSFNKQHINHINQKRRSLKSPLFTGREQTALRLMIIPTTYWCEDSHLVKQLHTGFYFEISQPSKIHQAGFFPESCNSLVQSALLPHPAAY